MLVVCFSIVLTWLSFHPGTNQQFGQNTLFVIALAIAGVVPLYFLFSMAKRWRRFAGGIALAAASAFMTSVYLIAHYLFHFDSVWLEGGFELSEGLFLMAVLLLIWRSAKG